MYILFQHATRVNIHRLLLWLLHTRTETYFGRLALFEIVRTATGILIHVPQFSLTIERHH